MELLDKFNADVEFRTRKEPILEILFRFLSIKILTNPYCEISKTRDEIEYQFGELKFKLGRQSGFFLWAIYFELKLSYYQFEEDEASQLLVFKEAMKFLNGKNGSKYWATFLLKNHPDHILRNPEFDFKSVMEDVELFLQKRGWLDEVSELTVKMYLLKIQYYIANELWPEAEKTINEAKAQMPNDSKNQSYLKFTIDLLQKEESLQYNTGKIESALQACTQAIDLCRLINLKHRLVDMLIDRNIANRKMGKLNKALEDVKMAMQTIREIGNLAPSKIGVSIFQYGQILKEAGNYEEAMKQYLECQQYWPNNSKGEYRKMITEMNMVYCIFHGNLNASLYFEISMSEKRDHIIDYFKKSENEIQLSPVNRKNLMGLGALKFT
jgi:tetratricopeptide (TPR) repeat protein